MPPHSRIPTVADGESSGLFSSVKTQVPIEPFVIDTTPITAPLVPAIRLSAIPSAWMGVL